MPKFNQKKTAEAVSYLLSKCPNETEYHLKIVKLLYIAERRAIQRWGVSLTNDDFSSLPHGPVNCATLNLINGYSEDSKEWDSRVSDKSNHRVTRVSKDEPEELSRAELEVLDEVSEEFKDWGRWRLVDYTHTFDEWEDLSDKPYSSKPISYESILKAGGHDQESIDELVSIRDTNDRLADLLA